MNSMQTIRQRFAYILRGEVRTGAAAPMLLQALTPAPVPGTYFWTDIDYKDASSSVWGSFDHYYRMQTIAAGLSEAYFRENPEALTRLTGALAYWVETDPHNPNWWYNDIGVPDAIGNTVILLYDLLPAELRTRATKIVARGSMATREDIAAKWTGTNLLWGTMNTLRHALLTEDAELLCAAVKRTEQELTVGVGEGIQTDGSFFQHGPRLYSCGYGRSFIHDIAHMCYALGGTEFAMSEDKLHAILLHVLDGVRYMTHKHGVDFASVGRELARPGDLGVGPLLRSTALLRDTEGMPRRDELAEYHLNMVERRPWTGTRYFPVVSMLCHHFDGLYVGAKLLNPRTWGAEICNEEGELCYNMSYGTHTAIMQAGDEYLNITPVWDYARIPGTTARTEDDKAILSHRGWWCNALPNDHCGGAQEGNLGVIYELAEHDGVSAYVSDFAIPSGFVCLGAHVCVTDGREEALVTTLDQCHARGSITWEGDAIIHNGIRYTPLAGPAPAVTCKKQVGSWKRNSFERSDAPVEASVMTLTITHPVGEVSAYGYMISSSQKPSPEVTVLQNDRHIQAIALADGTVLAVCHEAGTLSVNGRDLVLEEGVFIGRP